MAADPGMRWREGPGDLRAQLAEVAAHARELLRLEVKLAEEEGRQALAALRRGLMCLGAGAVLAVMAAGALLLAAVAALAIVWPPWLAAAVVGVVLGAAGFALFQMGSRRLSGKALRPRATLEEIQETKQWLKART